MADNDFPTEFFDQLDHDIEFDNSFLNKRISVRYRRNDIKAIIKTHSFLFPQMIRVSLLDISSKGAAIHSNKRLKIKTRISFFLLFDDGKRFTIDAIVANTDAAPRYGLKFDHYQAELADHLLATQTDLLFG